jgi:hypothetical protein
LAALAQVRIDALEACELLGHDSVTLGIFDCF